MPNSILEQVTELTGLPQELIKKELFELIQKSGKNANSLSMDELREILANYLQDIFLNIRNSNRP